MEPVWWLTKDGDRACLALYERHYSAAGYARERRSRGGFGGPGERIVLRTKDGDAAFIWKPIFHGIGVRDSGQRGICCSFFRNESTHRSSDLIAQADTVADFLWPRSRHYTYVDPTMVRSRNPGFCFLRAGWRRCGVTKGGLLVLEREWLASQEEQKTDQTRVDGLR